MEIKRFEERYNDLVNQFIVSIFIEEYKFEEYRDIIMNEENIYYQKSGGNFWICFESEEKIIGTIAIERIKNDKVIMKKMYVDNNYRGKGVAKQLFNMALDFCKENAVKEITLGTFRKMERAINFYIKNGFEEITDLKRSDGARFFRLQIEK